jgi:hypothetical protein
MRFTTASTLPAFIYVISLCSIFSFSWAIAQHNTQNSDSLKWENLTVEFMSQYRQGSHDVQGLESLPKEDYVVKSETEELVDYVFKKGCLCNDEDKAMCIQKTERSNDKTVRRLTVVAYFFPLGQKNYIYKIEFVDEKRTLIPSVQDVGHNLVNQEDWGKYKNVEKFLIKQKIIRDGETSLNTGQRIPLDGQPDLIFEDTYVQTKDHTLIHVENKTSKVEEDAPGVLKSYTKEMLEYVRNGCD